MLVHHFPEYYARNFPQNPCLTLDGHTTSYGELDRAANRAANGMLALGVGAGDRVCILGENSLEHLVLCLGAGKVGAVMVSLNYRLAPAELAYIINDADAKLLALPDGKCLDTLAAMRGNLPAHTALLLRGTSPTTPGGTSPSPSTPDNTTDNTTDNTPGATDWDQWLAGQADTHPGREVHPGDGFLQLYTSGTTGNPKGVVLTHASLLAEYTMNTTFMPERPAPGKASLICAPFFHIGGLGSAMISLIAGNQIILHRAFDPAAVVDALEQNPIDGVFMVPAMIMAVLDLPGIEQRDFSRLRYISYGASPISEAVLRRAIDVFGVEFVQMYGMTEATGTIVNLTPQDHARALAGKPELLQSCGRPSVGVQLRIVDLQGRDCATGEVGEIWVKSDSLMQSYHNLPEATAANLTDGWLHTGDAGYLDAEGYLYLKDRIKDMVVSGGENIYPVEVENAIASHEAVADVAVIGVPDERFGEALLACVVLRAGASLTVEEMVAFCRGRIAGYKIPRQLQIIDAMPRNPSGKILKKDLRRPYWEGAERNVG